MSEDGSRRAGGGLRLVDVRATVPAESQPGEPACGAAPDLAACFARHRIEWRGAQPAADGRLTWHFRAPDAESVRVALRHAAIPFDAVSVVRELDSRK